MTRTTLILFAVAMSCTQKNTLPQASSGERIVVTFEAGNTLGSLDAPLPINFNPSAAYTIHLEMHRADDSIDDSFDGYVRITTKPGTVYTVNDGGDGRNVKLASGVASNVAVTIVAAFGPTRIWAQDIGYAPVADLTRSPPPACADGIDNDNDGRVDYPADPGCFASNDDDETEGTGATGVSDNIYYALPRIADVRGGSTTSGTGTPFPNEQVNIDTGYDLRNNEFKWDTVVTGLVSDGFFATDLQNCTTNTTEPGREACPTGDPQAGLGYASVFAYTFSAPTKIGVCDRLRLLEATSSDFFGYTELNFPTWAVDYWDPAVGPCLVPEPVVIGIGDWTNTALLFKNESGLMRLLAQGTTTLHVGANFGAAHPSASSGYAPTPTATNCDLNGDGKVNFSDAQEGPCANACSADPECTEYASFQSNSGFTIVMTDGTTKIKTQGNATAATTFDPVAHKGQQIAAFTGMLRYFSGGSQFTLQARCDDDVIAEPSKQPLDSAHACVNQNGNNPDQQQ